MTMKKTWACVAAAAVFAALTLPVLGQGAGTKIKVIVENSSLRVKPNMDSEILEENVPLGTVFEQATKNGEWYEVKFQSKLGVMITGYIHEMYVEVVVTAPPVKPAVKPAVSPAAQPKPPSFAPAEARGRIEFGLAYGSGFGTPASRTTSYDRNVAVEYFLSHEEGRGTLNHTLKSLQGLALSFGYFFPNGLGFQLRADVNFKQSFSGNSVYDMNWTWTDNTSGSFHGTYPLTGEAGLTPLSLDLVYRIAASPVFHPYLGAGFTYFLGNFKADSKAGFPFWFVYSGVQYKDFALVPVKIDESLNSFGGNVLAGFDINFSPNIAFTVGGIYFIGSESNFKWTPVAGSYRCEMYPSFTMTLPQLVASSFAKDFTTLKVKTSNVKLVAGLKVGF